MLMTLVKSRFIAFRCTPRRGKGSNVATFVAFLKLLTVNNVQTNLLSLLGLVGLLFFQAPP
jgi:hypothetical protein